MNSRCRKGISGIIVLLLVVAIAALGCGSGGNDSPVTTAAPTGMTVGAYKVLVVAALADLQTAGDTAGAAITEATNQAGSETAAGLAQAEQIQQAAAQWATAIGGSGGAQPPRRSRHRPRGPHQPLG
jgi:flagellin-like protein